MTGTFSFHNEKLNGKPFILVAEDDVDDVELLMESLAKFTDIQLHVESNGRKAFDFLESLPIDSLPKLLIFDYNLPEINGCDVLNKIKDNPKYISIPKVVWSTSSSPVFKKTCIEYGAHIYYVKPADLAGFDSFAELIHSMLTGKA